VRGPKKRRASSHGTPVCSKARRKDTSSMRNAGGDGALVNGPKSTRSRPVNFREYTFLTEDFELRR
jgi:hypothetical protein